MWYQTIFWPSLLPFPGSHSEPHVFRAIQACLQFFSTEFPSYRRTSLNQGRKTKFAFPLYTVGTKKKISFRSHCIQGKRKFCFSSLVSIRCIGVEGYQSVENSKSSSSCSESMKFKLQILSRQSLRHREVQVLDKWLRAKLIIGRKKDWKLWVISSILL